MARSEEEILFKGNAAQFIQEVGKVIRKTKEHEASLKKLGGETKKVTKEEKELAREAKKAFDDIRGPQERYQRRMRALNELVKKGSITQREYARAARQAQERLRAAGRAGQQAFGAQALGQLKSFAMGYLGVSQAVSVVVRVLREEVEQRKELARIQSESALSAGALAQLTGGDPEKTAQLQAAGQAIFAAGGAKSQGEAMRAAFNLQSAGALKERGFVSRLAAIAGEEGIVGLTGEAGKLRKAFGEAEAGDYVQILSKATGAAAPLPKVGVSDILRATTKAAGSAVAMGLSDEELFAAVSKVAGPYAPDEASTAVARMFDQLSVKRPELKGKGLVEIMRTLEGEKMSEADLKKLLQIRGVRAYRVLKDVGGLQETLQTVEQAQRDRAIMGVMKGGEESPLVYAPRQKQIEEAREEVGRTRIGMEQNMLDAEMARIRRFGRDEGAPEWLITLFSWGQTLGSAISDPKAQGLRTLGGAPEDLQVEWRGKWDKLDRAAESLERAAETLNQTSRQRPVEQSNQGPEPEGLERAAESLERAAESMNETARQRPVQQSN